MNLTRLVWTRLIGSRYLQELETLKNRLSKAGIISEIRGSLAASKRGMTRFEIVVDERDLFKASKICQRVENGAGSANPSQTPGGSSMIKAAVSQEESEPATKTAVTKTAAVPSATAEPPRGDSGPRPESSGTEPDSELARATTLLENQVEELLVTQNESSDHCSRLEEKVKTLEESVTQARTDVAAEESNRASTEKKLAEISEARALLEQEMQALEVRFKAAEETLAASQTRVESQTKELNAQQARIVDLEKAVSERDAQLERVTELLAKAVAGTEQQKTLRLAAEKKCLDLAAAREREQFLKERHDEEMRACVGKVNALYSRVRTALAAREKQ